jgi:hypothetical protein
MIGGCQLLRMNEGRALAAQMAGYAGRFRIAYGRWPTDVNELEEFVCMRGRADSFDLDRIDCDELVRMPYSTQITSRSAHLQMQFFDSAKKPICRLLVLAPPADADAAVFPMIVVKTSVFSCRGGPENP